MDIGSQRPDIESGVIGKVNGVDILYNNYRQLVENQRSQAVSDQRMTYEQERQIHEQVWRNIVTNMILEQDIERRNIKFTDQELLGFKGKGAFLPVLAAESIKTASQFCPHYFDIGLHVPLPIGQLKAASKVDKVQVPEVLCRFEEDFRGVQEDFDVQDVASGMHVDPVDVHSCQFHDPQKVRDLVDADAEFGIDVADGNFRMAPCHYMGVDPDAHGYLRVPGPELLQDREVVDVDAYPQSSRFLQ